MRLIDADAKEPYVLDGRYAVNTLVRCKDCKWKADTIGDSWCDFHEFTILSDDDFCSCGERKDNG